MKIPEAFPESMSYLGDGAYVGHDSMQLWIGAERGDGQVHRVALGQARAAGLDGIRPEDRAAAG